MRKVVGNGRLSTMLLVKSTFFDVSVYSQYLAQLEQNKTKSVNGIYIELCAQLPFYLWLYSKMELYTRVLHTHKISEPL